MKMGIADAITLILSLVAIIFSVVTFLANVSHDRKKATLEAYNHLQRQALDELYKYMPKDINEIVKNRRTEEYKVLSSYVARIEHFAVGVNQGIYNINTVYELAHGFLDGGIRTRLELLTERKSEGFDEEFYQNIKLLYKKMDKMSEKKRKKS